MPDSLENKTVYVSIINKINADGALHFSLIDPDPLRQSPERAAIMAKYCEEAGSDAILVGGSTITNQIFVSETIDKIKEAVNIPVIIFPGSMTGFSPRADAILFMSLLNSNDPNFIVGQQALAAYAIRMSGIEYISVSYLIVEPGSTAGWMGNARLLPRNNPELAAAFALTSEMFGFRMVYLDAGSDSNMIPHSHISRVAGTLTVPLIAGGGIKTKEDARSLIEAGADIIVMGSFIEENLITDKGESLRLIVQEVKAAGKKKNKKFFAL